MFLTSIGFFVLLYLLSLAFDPKLIIPIGTKISSALIIICLLTVWGTGLVLTYTVWLPLSTTGFLQGFAIMIIPSAILLFIYVKLFFRP